MRKGAILLFAYLFLSLAPLGGCAEVTQVGTTLGEGAGLLSKEDKEGLERLATQTAKAVRPMNDQEENYLGRAVAATLLNQYRLHANDALTAYVNEVGQAVALASDRPLTFGGYHFAVLDSDQVNALSCPGGMIFITQGMLQKIRSEDELAAVLAHEVAHVNHKDGVAAIQSSRWVEAASVLGSEAARKLGGAELTKIVSVFEGSVDDVVKTLLVKGYSREQEKTADESALSFLHRLDYNPQALADYLERLAGDQGAAPKGTGIFATHPGMAERASDAKSSISQNRWTRKDVPERDRRFRQILGKG